jgi:hypothetical protein
MIAIQYDLLILAPNAFLNTLKPLKDHKNQTGIATAMLGLDEIYRDFPGRDGAEKVKNCLVCYRRKNGIRFAMLVGDCDKFPVRYTKTDRADPKAHNTAFYAADLYYADLFEPDGSVDDWDRNRNGYFGELRGESSTGILNLDDVDLRPDISVGRIPASTASEVETYVKKVIGYEKGHFQPAWFKKALLIATTDWASNACQTQEEIAQQCLTGLTIHRLYASGNPCQNTPALNANEINNKINSGVGFVSYIGHGYPTGWAGCYDVSNLSALTNSDNLPLVFASACDTSQFTTQPPYSQYTDINGVVNQGTNNGEFFHSTPPQPACIQTVLNPESLGESMTVKYGTGAIGYVGCVTGAQPWSRDLNKYFFEAYRYGHETLGGMWNYMIQRYYELHVLPEIISNPDWTKVAEFHQPWKFFLFGDPSLRVGGINTDLCEDCIHFDYHQARIAYVRGRWKIAVGSMWLLDFGVNQSAAIKAWRIINHYKLNSQCFVGRPNASMEYYLTDGKSPVGPFSGEDSIGFNPSAVTVKKIQGRWKIVEGDHWILDFDQKEQEALKAFRVIQKYGFNRICFVGRPNAEMIYFRR